MLKKFPLFVVQCLKWLWFGVLTFSKTFFRIAQKVTGVVLKALVVFIRTFTFLVVVFNVPFSFYLWFYVGDGTTALYVLFAGFCSLIINLKV